MIADFLLSIDLIRIVRLLRCFEKTSRRWGQLLYSVAVSPLLAAALCIAVLLVAVQPVQAEQGIRQKGLSLSSSWTNRDPRWPITVGDMQLDVGSCDGHALGLGLGIEAPTPPQPYDLPPEADAGCVDASGVDAGDQPSCVIVHNAVQLQEQAASTQSKLIIL